MGIKIIRLVPELNFGGVEKRLVNVSRVNDKNDWIFCALGNGGNAAEAIKQNGKRVVLFQNKIKIPSLGTLRALISFFNREKPDVVHTSGAEANFHGILAAKIAGVKKIVGEEIGIPGQSKIANIVFQLVYFFADYLIANSQDVRTYLSEKNRVPNRKLKLVDNPIGLIPQDNLPISPIGCFEMVTVSRLEKIKNIDGILKVLSILIYDFPQIRFTIIGQGSHEANLRKIIQELALEKHVHFLGYRNDPFKAIGQADLFVLNSYSEGFSNALTEAMSNGIPCLSTDVGVASYTIEDGVSGWLVEPDSSDQLEEKLRTILALDKNKLIEIGAKGKDRVSKSYSLERHINDLMKIYL